MFVHYRNVLVKRFTVFVTDVSKFCGKKSLRELGCAFSVTRCTVPLTCQQQIYFPCGLLDLFSAASEFAVIFKLLYSGTDKDCVFYFCIIDSGNWHRLVDVKHLHSDLHKIHHSLMLHGGRTIFCGSISGSLPHPLLPLL